MQDEMQDDISLSSWSCRTSLYVDSYKNFEEIYAQLRTGTTFYIDPNYVCVFKEHLTKNYTAFNFSLRGRTRPDGRRQFWVSNDERRIFMLFFEQNFKNSFKKSK